MQKLSIFKLLFPLLVIVTLYGHAMPQSSAQTQSEFQYAAKFVCGKSDGEFAARGQYFTIINVHNPLSKEVNIRKKFALGKTGEDVGDISGLFHASIGADKVMGIDCPDIYKHSHTKDGTFIEGYAVLLSPWELDVVSVFTAGEDHVETLHTERVPFRKVSIIPEVCSDLNMNISTGFSPWRIIADPISSTTEPRSVIVLLGVNDTTVGPFPFLAGSLWVGPLLNAGTVQVPRGPYKYELHFCLCRGFSNAKLSLDGFADDSATVSFNGTPIGGLGMSSVSHINATSGFLVDNTITVVVTNKTNSPTGLNIRGSITATAGSCSGNTPQ